MSHAFVKIATEPDILMRIHSYTAEFSLSCVAG